MIKAYILITTRPGTSEETAKELRKVKGVLQAESVYGRFDVIALVQGDDHKNLNEIVYKAVGSNPKVIHSETCIVLF
jgi:DNA-binding Lrp family transcriptional regulator